VAGVEQQLDRLLAVALLAFGDVVAREHQVVEDALGVGPGAEQVVALEEGVVAVGGVRDHQRLHGHGVLFHEVGDAGAGVDDDLVGQPHLAALVALLGGKELLAVGPVVIAHRHADRGIGVHHLLGGDDLDLVGVGVEAVVGGDAGDLAVVGSSSSKVHSEPSDRGWRRGGGRWAYGFPFRVPYQAAFFLNSSRNTG
jgi:hypothetical protein